MINYEWVPCSMATPEMLSECARLYSGHYGRWSQDAPYNAGQPIRMGIARLKAWFDPADARLATARDEAGVLVGYAIAVRAKIERYGVISWVSQLVVHTEYRRARIATALLFSIWGFSNHYAWGLVTANPYAVRALEKATRRRCVPRRIARNKAKLLSVGASTLPYIHANSEIVAGSTTSRINTAFYLDHSELPHMLESATKDSSPWILGDLPAGWEWLAFTFHDQEQLSLTQSEVDEMLSTSDDITRRAYGRMVYGESHAWAKHAEKEAQFIVEALALPREGHVLDFGCGDGRHCMRLAALGMNTLGVDYLEGRIQEARRAARFGGYETCTFMVGDCRDISLGGFFDGAICLYDVVGTYASDDDNLKILQNLARHLRRGARCLISVMSMEFTRRQNPRRFNVAADPDELLHLKPSDTMERTGNIFDPDYCLVDDEAGVVYRKEQFSSGSKLPEELIVRDRRFTTREIVTLCERAGLRVTWTKHVRAGKWNRECPEGEGKEILILCESK